MTREKHPGRVALKVMNLLALNKKRKGEILRSKKQSTEQSTVQPTVQSTVLSLVQYTVQSAVQPKANYVYGVGILAVVVIGVSVFFAYNTFQPKKLINERKGQTPKQHHML